MTITADDVWRLLAELIESQKETERKLKNTEQTLKEFIQKTEKRFQNTDALLAELIPELPPVRLY